MDMKRINYSSGAPLEEKVGYSRMVRIGPFVKIGGTTSVQPDGTVFGEGSAYDQTHYVLDKQVGLLQGIGLDARDVYSVKIYTTDMTLGQEISKAYSEFFKEVRPLFTMVGTPMLNRSSQLVEIELEAAVTE